MTLDDIRKLAAEERTVADKATRPPWSVGPRLHEETCASVFSDDGLIVNLGDGHRGKLEQDNNAAHIARSRTAVPALCDAIDALLAVVDALPLCSCGAHATWEDLRGGHYCDVCAGPNPKYSRSLLELPYAAALRGRWRFRRR